MSEPQRPQLAPYEVQVEKGNDYWLSLIHI